MTPKSVPVMFSTIPLHEQLARLETSLPFVRELVLATAPADPLRSAREEMLRATVLAIAWLHDALGEPVYGGPLADDYDENWERAGLERPRLDADGLERVR